MKKAERESERTKKNKWIKLKEFVKRQYIWLIQEVIYTRKKIK